MPILKAWIVRCAGGCARNEVHYNYDRPMEKREAEALFHEHGWRELFGDWYCTACGKQAKAKHRARQRVAVPSHQEEVPTC